MMPIFLALGAGTVPAVEPWCWHWRYPLFGPILILDSWTAWWGPMRKMSFEAARSAKSEGVCGSHGKNTVRVFVWYTPFQWENTSSCYFLGSESDSAYTPNY